MMNKLTVLFVLTFSISIFGQIIPKDTIRVENYPTDSISTKTPKSEIEVYTDIQESNATPAAMKFNPTKAGLYSAVLPGLGQYYNKKYWKIPIVYGAIGVSMYYYINSNQKYNQYRDAYKRRLEGYTDDAFSFYDNNRLISAQKFYQRNRDLSALFVVGFYVLNIVDASVDAALIQFNVNENLSVRPDVYMNDVTSRANVGLTFNYNF